MKLTKERKVYLGILAVGLVALVADRVFLGGGGVPPSSAEAAATPLVIGPIAQLPQARAPGTASAWPKQPNVSIADRLAAVATTEGINTSEVKDAFGPSAAWLAQLRPSADRPSGLPLDLAEAFCQRHRLTAVMVQGGGGKAIVDDKCLAVGEKIDGFALVAVEHNSAVFACGDRRAELKLPQTQPSATDK